MYTFKINGITPEQYDRFVLNHPNANLLQTRQWASIKDNWENVTYSVHDENGNVLGTALALVKRLPAGLGLMYIPRGPITDWNDDQLLKFFLENIRKDALKRKVVLIKLDPAIEIARFKTSAIPQSREAWVDSFNERMKALGLHFNGFTKEIAETIQPRYQSTVFAPLDYPKHTNRLIKDADKRGVEIEFGGLEKAAELADLTAKTENRKGVHLRNQDYFEKLMKTYGNDAVISTAYANVDQLAADAQAKIDEIQVRLDALPAHANKKKKQLDEQMASQQKIKEKYDAMIAQGMSGRQPIASILSIKAGPVLEMLYAGMDERYKAFMPQHKNYTETFKWAFEHGCTAANMGGVEGTFDDGLTQFKDNFNPDIVEYIGEYDLPVFKPLYPAVKYAYNKVKNKMNA